MLSLARRLLVTFSVPALVLFLSEYLTLPGLPPDVVAEAGGPSRDLGVFALGIGSVLTAFTVVELVALVVPRWSRLRSSGPAGRAKLDRAAAVLSLLLVFAQAYSSALALVGVGSPDVPARLVVGEPWTMAIVTGSLMVGVFLQVVAAWSISRQGLLNGFVLLLLCARGRTLVPALVGAGQLSFGRDLAIAWLSVLAVVIATACVLTRPSTPAPAVADARAPAGDPPRDARPPALAPFIPLPSGSIGALSWAWPILLLPSIARGFFGSSRPVDSVLDSPLFTPALVVLGIVLSYIFARVMHRPDDVLADPAAATAETTNIRTAALRRALARTYLPTFLFAVVVSLAERSWGGAQMVAIAMATAAALDLARAVRATREHPGRVPVWEERRASAVPVLRAVLAREGIASDARGIAFLGLEQVFAPYAPAMVYVEARDAQRALAVVRSVVLGEAKSAAVEPSTTHEDSAVPRDGTSVVAAPATTSAPAASFTGRSQVLAACAVVMLGTTASRMLARHAAAVSPVAAASTISPALEVVRVDDDLDPLGKIPDGDVLTVAGLGLFTESVYRGTPVPVKATFARVALAQGESAPVATGRLRRWLDTVPLPAGERFAIGEVVQGEPGEPQTIAAVRSYLLRDAPVLVASDVEDAVVVEEPGTFPTSAVTMRLAPDAAKRFEQATGAWTHRRLALVVSGEVSSAPLVRQAIAGGQLTVTMGGPFDTQRDQAEQLASALHGKR